MRIRFSGILLAMLGLPLCAQELVSVRVFTRTPQAMFYVDEQLVTTGSIVVTWPVGSKHILRADCMTDSK